MDKQVKFMNYFKKILMEERTNLTAIPYTPQKPMYKAVKNIQKLKRSSPEKEGLSTQNVVDFVESVADEIDINAQNIMMTRNGKVIGELAFSPFKKEMWHVTHSLSKTILSMAVGYLVTDGKLSLDEKVVDIFADKIPLLPSARLKQLTVKDLLMMSSGVSLNESAAVTTNDWIKDYLRAEITFEPGESFQYNSMNSYMLSAIIKRKTGKNVMDYLRPRLFVPLGITNIAWEKSNEGHEKGGWGMYVTIEDLTKIGILLMHDGKWNVKGKEKQVFPQDWIKEMVTIHQPSEKQNDDYGYHIWISRKNDYYYLSGLFGQLVFVHPATQTVVTMFAANRNILNNGGVIEKIKKHLLKPTEQFQQETIDSSTTFESNEYVYRKHVFYPATYEELVVEETTMWDKIKEKFGDIKEKKYVTKQYEGLPPVFNAFENATYMLEKNAAGLLPFIYQMIDSNYSKGTKIIKIKKKTKYLQLIWEEEENTFKIPIGVYEPKYTTIEMNGEYFEVGSYCSLSRDEDNRNVLKVTVAFLETSSTRRLKFHFREDNKKVKIRFDEDPSFIQFVNAAMSKINIKQLLGFFISDTDYLDYTAQRLATPTVWGHSTVGEKKMKKEIETREEK